MLRVAAGAHRWRHSSAVRPSWVTCLVTWIQHCSIVQVFTESTHIVAIRTSGNVYAWEAVEELNIKPRFMRDLLTDQSFTRKDIIHIQDPMNLEASLTGSLSCLHPAKPVQSPPIIAEGLEFSGVTMYH